MKRKTYIILIILFPFISVFLFSLYLHHVQVSFSRCVFFELSGWQCPGCGAKRSFHALLHGQFTEALRYNALLLLSLPFILYLYYYLTQVYILKNTAMLNKSSLVIKTGFVLLGITAIFFVLRNIPSEPFIYLSPS